MHARRIIVGLLGAVASGKSHVARRLAALGPGRVVDADALAHEALDAAARDGRLAALLGPAAVREGRADREALRQRAHADAAVLRALEGLTHPAVRARIEQEVAAHRRGEGPPVLVLDVPLLLEAGLDGLCDELWFVEAPDALRRSRALARGTPPEALAGWARHQAADAAKRARAARVIANGADPVALDTCLREALAAPAHA
ncbi:MAG: dephospho-CoA kinase [Planctomycetia bacterium]